jgi:hypothetical protein
MKLLRTSADPQELEGLVKRLICAGIPCAVCKDTPGADLSVWVQQDNDFPLALKIFVSHGAPRPVPRWAYLLDEPLFATEETAVPVAGERPGPAPDGRKKPEQSPRAGTEMETAGGIGDEMGLTCGVLT